MARNTIGMPQRIVLAIAGFAMLLLLYFITIDDYYPVEFTALGIDVSRYVYAAGLILLSVFAGLMFKSGLTGKWDKVIG